DSDGNVLSMVTSSASTFYAYNTRNWATNQTEIVSGKRYSVLYGYDQAGNIVSTTYPDGYTLSTSYDALNRVHQLGSFATFHYTPYNRLVSAGSVSFTYDANGNTVTKVNGSTSWSYAYDFENRLMMVEKNAVTVAKNLYDGAGNMVVSVEGGTQQAFGYQGINRIYATNLNSSSTADSFYANGLLVASRNASAVSYDQEDAIGSVRRATHSGGIQSYSSNYKPFGTSYGTAGSSSVGYAGKPSDSVTGLYYFGAR